MTGILLIDIAAVILGVVAVVAGAVADTRHDLEAAS